MVRTALLAPLMLLASPAIACLPPPPGMVEPPPPTVQEMAANVARNASDIAYGVIISETGQEPRFRVIHVYKGALRKGQVIRPALAHAITQYPVPCPGMIPPQPSFKGSYGVIAFSGPPQLAFVEDAIVEQLIASGLIASARAK